MAKINELLKQEVIPLSDELPAVDDPEVVLKNALGVMGKSGSDWNHHFDAVTNVRKVIVNNPEQVNSSPQKLKNTLIAVLDQVDNLRSLVSRNAITCCADAFAKLGKVMDNELDHVLPRLLKKYGDTSKFYEEECDKAIKQCIAHCSSSKVLTVLIANANHKHAMVRAKVAFFMATCVTGNMGARVLKFKEIQKLLQAIAQLLQDGSSETRIRAKQTLFAIYNYMTEDEFEKLINRNVSPSEIRTLKETIIKLKKEQSIGTRPDMPNDTTDSHTASPNTKSPLASTDPSPSPSPATPTSGISRIKPPIQRSHAKDSSTDHSPASGGPGTLREKTSKPPAPAEYVFKSPTKAESALNDMEENITVAVRVRPMNRDERGREIWKVENDTVSCVDEISNANRSLSFAFDNAFGQSFKSTQDIYEKVGQGIVYSVMEGYNGTVFAYGQTNSGKTYTMMGNDDNPGFIPLAISSIFDYIKNTPQREFLLRVSYLEIYNEVINDLLRLEGSNLNIREDKKRGVYIEGLKEEIVVSPEHVMHVINSGEAHRHVASTDYNLISSRSHTIFRIIIESSIAEADKKSRVSCLTLIDLAGSEKVVSDSIVRKREGAYINKSLLTLGSIISKLSERKKGEKIGHLPYRDSKLTRILESSLSGNAKIAIIATVTPASPNFEETTNTLKFAARAKKVTKEKAVVNEDEKALLAKYKAEIEDLRRKLEMAQEAETKLKDLQEQSQNQQVEELKKELLEQEELRASLEEKIKQLTKLILVSATVEGNRTRTFTNHISDPKRIRSATIKGLPLANVKGSEDDAAIEENEPGSKESLEKRLHTLEKINEAMTIKIEALQQQAEWRDKQIHKIKVELKEKDEKLRDVVNMKVSESDKLEQLKVMLIKQYAEQIEKMQDEIKEKEMEVSVLKADTKLLVEKILRLEK